MASEYWAVVRDGTGNLMMHTIRPSRFLADQERSRLESQHNDFDAGGLSVKRIRIEVLEDKP